MSETAQKLTEFDLSEDEFVELIESSEGKPSVVKLSTRIGGVLDSRVQPLEAYSALRNGYTFLLESAETDVSALRHVPGTGDSGLGGTVSARYSFVGFEPDAVVRVDEREVEVEKLRDSAVVGNISQVAENREIDDGNDTLDALRSLFPDAEPVNFEESERQVFAGGFVGYLSYDVVHDLWIDTPRGESRVPDAEFVLSTRNIVFDHSEDTVSLVFTPVIENYDEEELRRRYRQALSEANETLNSIDSAVETNDCTPEFEILGSDSGHRDEYEKAVEETREHIFDGDIYQAVISRKREIDIEGDVRDFYSELRDVNPSPYMYLVEFDDFGVVGSSPETLVSVHDGTVRTNPIAGTCPRGETAVEDRRLAGEMLSDEKELAEHVMLVDLGRNDVRRVSESGTIDVEDFMSVVQYSHVQHIESTVAGELREGKDAFDATRSTFPAGTLSGAPKIRAMEIISSLENNPRGVYGGGVGYYSWDGDADLAIAIRTATFNHRSERRFRAKIQAGAGIVADSVPDREYDETEDKMGALVDAMEELSSRTDDKGVER